MPPPPTPKLLLPSDRQLTCVCPQASDHKQAPGEEPSIPLGQLEASCRTKYGYSGTPSLHLQPGALLASLVTLLPQPVSSDTPGLAWPRFPVHSSCLVLGRLQGSWAAHYAGTAGPSIKAPSLQLLCH